MVDTKMFCWIRNVWDIWWTEFKVEKNSKQISRFVTKYVPDQHQTQRMCDKVILENGGMLNVYSWLLQET